jgi:hypothetical protein
MGMTNQTSPQSLQLPDGCFLRKKTLYEYTTPDNVYDVELFENEDGTAYAIGIPREGRRVIIFGTPVLPSRERALQAFITKVKSEGYMANPDGVASETDALESDGRDQD